MRASFQAFLAGDDAAFAELYGEVNPRLSAYCHKLAPGHTEDLMQELWERVIALRSRRKAQEIESPLAFLYRTLKNLAIDHFRKAPETLDLALAEEQDPSTQPTDLECLVLDGVEQLPVEEREILVLNIYSGYKFGEIAEMLDKSPEAIWQRASRARARLRKIVIADAARLGISIPAITGKIKKETVG